MTIQRITAIVPIAVLEKLESHLRKCGVPGVTVEHVQGYGEHPNFFRHNLMQDNARVVLYVDSTVAPGIVEAMASCSHECGAMAGVLVVETIERLVSLVDGADILPGSG